MQTQTLETKIATERWKAVKATFRVRVSLPIKLAVRTHIDFLNSPDDVKACALCGRAEWIGYTNREPLVDGTFNYYCVPCSDSMFAPVFCKTCKASHDGGGFCDCAITGARI